MIDMAAASNTPAAPYQTPSRAENNTVSKTINAAVIGYGGAFNMGRLHLNWMKAAGFTPYAVCDLDPARTASAGEDFPGIKTFTDYHQLLADPDVHLAVCILPHNLHGKVNLDIVSAGKHCVCEKPFTITVAEADACIEMAKAKGVTLSVFHNRRYDGDHLAMMEIIRKGEIGEVFHIEAGMGGFHFPGDWWRADKQISGGNLYDWGVHFLDWVLDLIPDPIENVTGFFHKRVWDKVSNEDQTQAIIRFKSGKYADVRISSIDAAPRDKFRILGTKGAIQMSHEWTGEFTLRRYLDGELWEKKVNFERKHYKDAGQAYYDMLGAHLFEGAPLAVTAESARRNIAVIEAAEASSKSHQAEPVAHE
jgi:predicted dehydrogenase